MDKPTDKQIEELWKWCGFIKHSAGKEMWRYDVYKETNHWWEAPGGRKYKDLPLIDLNNLFKAVPKLESKMPLAYWVICLIEDWAEGKNPDPALALFWVIHEVIKGRSSRKV